MNGKLLKILYASAIAALTCVLTMFIKIPVTATNGYIHLGDGIIFIGVYLIGLYAVPAAAVGSMLADLFSGYAIYMLPTFIIKGLIAFICYLVLHKKDSFLWLALGSVVGSLVMAFGYFFVEAVFMGYGLGAFAALPMNLIQGAFAVGISACIVAILQKMKFRQRIKL